MNQNWQDSSSIYLQKHQTFYRWILYPIIVVLLLIGVFLIFAKKEIVIKAPAQLTANTKKLETPIEAKIIKNNLYENKAVKKNELLVLFDTQDLQLQKESLEKENNQIAEEKIAAKCFIESLNSGTNQFKTPDSFGYENQLKSIFAENEANEFTMKQKSIANQKEHEAYQKRKIQLEQQINTNKDQLSDWSQVRNAWQNQQDLEGFSEDIMSEYKAWETQLTVATTKEQEDQIKSTATITINDRITQIKNEIEQLEAEHAQLVSPVTIDNELNSQKELYTQKIESAITTTKQKISVLTTTEEKNTSSIKSLNNQIKQSTIKAPIDGKIHLNTDIIGITINPKGTVLAEIYPYVNKKEQPFTAYIPATKMTHITKNMPIHFKLDKKGVISKTLNGKLTKIAETSTITEKGNFYLIEGVIDASKETELRYGLSGELSLIIGKKTYLQQLRDWIFNNL